MGNSLLKFLGGRCFEDDEPVRYVVVQGDGRAQGVADLSFDLLSFELSSQVPEGLSRYVSSSKKAQAIWYQKILEAWKSASPAPKTPEAAAILVIITLRSDQQADVEGLLSYYGLPIHPNYDTVHELSSSSPSSRLEKGVQFVLRTLPVDAKDVGDGDGITVYVDTADPKESADIPIQVQEAAIRRNQARAAKNFEEARELMKIIRDQGYRFRKNANGEEILAKKYRIRLKGVDAPESIMPYGKEAKDELTELVNGKCLKIKVYCMDKYGRSVGDVYCDGIFVQEQMLKRGFVWHYTAFDQRAEFARWQEEARAAYRGLWNSSNPEKPWNWRKRNAGWRGGTTVPVAVC